MLDALDSGRPPLVTGEDGWRAVRLVEAIYESSAQNKEIDMGDENI
ncbi:Gfo/Idh/MocA family oxidoreductase [Paenibacillus sp. CC-CFT747]|nr:Gfo/Idh/MocA family oxidoreductase [Paenibacillus sp. CC-CFT747]